MTTVREGWVELDDGEDGQEGVGVGVEDNAPAWPYSGSVRKLFSEAFSLPRAGMERECCRK